MNHIGLNYVLKDCQIKTQRADISHSPVARWKKRPC